MIIHIFQWTVIAVWVVLLMLDTATYRKTRRKHQEEIQKLQEARTQLLQEGKKGYESLVQAADEYNRCLDMVIELMDALTKVKDAGLKTIHAWDAEREELRAMLDKRIKREAGRRKAAGK